MDQAVVQVGADGTLSPLRTSCARSLRAIRRTRTTASPAELTETRSLASSTPLAGGDPAANTSTHHARKETHHTGKSSGARTSLHPVDSASLSLPFHSSRMVRYGITMLAMGKTHHPTAHPGENRGPDTLRAI